MEEDAGVAFCALTEYWTNILMFELASLAVRPVQI